MTECFEQRTLPDAIATMDKSELMRRKGEALLAILLKVLERQLHGDIRLL